MHFIVISNNGKQKGDTLAIEEKCIGHRMVILGQREHWWLLVMNTRHLQTIGHFAAILQNCNLLF